MMISSDAPCACFFQGCAVKHAKGSKSRVSVESAHVRGRQQLFSPADSKDGCC
jgi:hypothetical protein